MDIAAIKSKFDKNTHIYKQLKEEALFILDPAINDANIKLHSITHRVKNVDSFMDKIQRKQSESPFEDIRDIVGIRVICLFLSDIERIGNVIRESFKVLEEDNKVEGADVSSFGYMSVHFIVMMKAEHSGPRYDPIAKLPFEIQVRTIAMDAWANVSHYLSYKSDKDVPTELRRDFYALSGLFYVADRHFEMFFRSSEESQERMVELFKEAPQQIQLDQEINLDSLTVYLQNKFPDREHSEPRYVSGLVNELHISGIKSLSEIDHAIEIAYKAAEEYERINPPGGRASSIEKYSDVGIVRQILALTNERFRKRKGAVKDPLTLRLISKYKLS